MKRFIGLMIVLAMGILFISGCSSSPTVSNGTPLNSGQEIKIAVLGSEEQFAKYQDFFNGADMAIEELAASGVKFSYEKIDDQGNYDNAVNIAAAVAKDSNYAMAVTIQDVDVVGPVAYLFDESQKPLIVASQALSKLMAYGFRYVINSTLLAAEQGYLAGKLAIENNVKWVVASHSASPFDKEFINGFQYATNNTTVKLLDIREVSNSLGDLTDIANTFTTLKPDAVLIAHYDAQHLVETIKAMRQYLKSNVNIFTNASILNSNTVAANKDVLTSVSGVSSYPVDISDKSDKFIADYKAKYGAISTTSSCQGYDIVKLIAEKIQGASTTLAFMENVKSDEGYSGLAKLKFDMLGRLISENGTNKFYIDANGNVTIEKLNF